MKVQIVNKSAWATPAYATEKSAGMDLKANIDEFVGEAPQFDDITMLAINFDAIIGDESVSVIPAGMIN